jgi:D-beta-D-heptose 7-phosphate kinase/D-beta-D-heptose 1-phosphate adenosyltransferase
MIRVYGDIMLDKWVHGTTDRISPEAPVPVLLEHSVTYSPGGAANLAASLHNLGNDIELYSTCAEDDNGNILQGLLNFGKVTLDLTHSVTTTKTRLVGQGGQHILRWDKEKLYTGPEILHRLQENMTEADTIVVSDYGKGTIRENTVNLILNRCKRVLVDPKQAPHLYAGVFLIKPNLKEYKAWGGELTTESATALMAKYNWQWLVVTAGADGLYVFDNNGEFKHFHEPVREVADVTGAGDAVLAVIAHCFEKGMNIYDACEIACFAAARTVEHRGVVLVQPADLSRGVVFTNGCFDILHLGHLKLLKHAATLGRRLVVGINSDASVQRLKGKSRPINNQAARQQALEQLGFVNEVVVFDQDTPYELIKQLHPAVIVKGGDYTPDQVVGHDIAPVVIFPIIEGYSTTKIIKEIKCQD